MKCGKLRRKSKSPQRKLEDSLWSECRRVADSLYKGQEGTYTCFICERPISGSNKQLSHLIPKSVCGAFLKYDVYRNLKYCCYNCNINLGGNLAEYYRKMLKIHGKKYMDKLYADKQKTIKATEHYEKLLKEYSIVLL